MKAKILNSEQAEALGLKKPSAIIGRSVIMVGKSKEDPGKIVEEQIIRENHKKELIFMSNERKQELKSKKQLTAYLKQFDKIPRGLK